MFILCSYITIRLRQNIHVLTFHVSRGKSFNANNVEALFIECESKQRKVFVPRKKNGNFDLI